MRMKFFVTALLSAVALQASAFEFISTNTYQSAADQLVNDEQWILADQIDTKGLHKNDLFLMAGQTNLLSGSYEGNIWAVSGLNTIFTGDSKRNVRLTGSAITVDGTIGGNLMAMGETVIIGTNAVVAGDMMIYANTIVQEGTIAGNADLSALRIATVGGTIEGNTSIKATEIILDRNAHFAADLSYTTGKELFPDEGMIQGRITRVVPEPEPLFSTKRLTIKSMWFFAAVLAGIPFISLFPMTSAMSSQLIRKSPLKCLLVGMVASIALPAIALMCATSLIGVPLGTLIIASWGILLYTGRILAGLVLGTLILQSMGVSIGRVILATALGLAIIYFSTVIPSIGIPVQLASLWIGMGALLISLMEKRRLILQVPHNLQQLEKLRDEQYNPEEDS